MNSTAFGTEVMLSILGYNVMKKQRLSQQNRMFIIPTKALGASWSKYFEIVQKWWCNL
jgi:hypothetical protein